MHLTPKLKVFVLLVATDTYLRAAEGGKIPFLTTQQRLEFTEQLAFAAILSVDAEPNACRNHTAEYQKRIECFFESDKTFKRLWRKFEFHQAEADGVLSPARIVADLLGDTQLDYGQKSKLESFAVIGISEAKKKKYDLSRTLRFVQRFVTSRPLFIEAIRGSEVAQT